MKYYKNIVDFGYVSFNTENGLAIKLEPNKVSMYHTEHKEFLINTMEEISSNEFVKKIGGVCDSIFKILLKIKDSDQARYFNSNYGEMLVHVVSSSTSSFVYESSADSMGFSILNSKQMEGFTGDASIPLPEDMVENIMSSIIERLQL